MYRYDAQTHEVRCVSCTSGDPGGDAELGAEYAQANQLDLHLPGSYVPSAVLDDGGVYVETPAALDPRDVNGLVDVYETGAGAPRLISSGRSSGPSTFMAATPDGRSVFFRTEEPLVGQDQDAFADVYVARVDGGLVSQERPAPRERCADDDCQGRASDPPAPAPVGSDSLAGEGNVHARPPAARSKVAVARGRQVAGPTATLRVRVSSAGRIAVSGAGVRRAVRTTTRAATYQVKVALGAAARQTLRRRQRMAVKVKVAFQPKAGRSAVRTVMLTFVERARHAAAKGSRRS